MVKKILIAQKNCLSKPMLPLQGQAAVLTVPSQNFQGFSLSVSVVLLLFPAAWSSQTTESGIENKNIQWSIGAVKQNYLA